METTIITNVQKRRVIATFRNANRDIVKPGGIPEWVSADETVATLDVAPDGLSAYVISDDTNQGLSVITVTDPEERPDGSKLSNSFQAKITKEPDGATSIEFTFEDPILKS